jgi:hypothetical protein
VLLLHLATEYTDELVPIAVIQEDRLLGIAADGDDVGESTRKFEAEWASHETRHDGAGSAKSKTDPASPLIALTRDSFSNKSKKEAEKNHLQIWSWAHQPVQAGDTGR